MSAQHEERDEMIDDTGVTVAAIQAAPVFLNRDATVDKACALIAQAGRAGARLAVFPEAFIPGYPDWVWAIPPGEDALLRGLYVELVGQSVSIPSDATDRLCEAARDAHLYVVMGMSEVNAEASGASIYNTLLFIGDEGAIIGKHRKLVPTGGERTVWTPGDGSTVGVYETAIGRLGGLICWENYMPLARYALYAWGVQIYVAATWDRSNAWLTTLQHIAMEGGVFVIGCCTALHRDDLPESPWKQRFYTDASEWISVGNSVIIAPDRRLLAGPCAEKEEILYAVLEPGQIPGRKHLFDVAGHYARPDVFELTVNRAVKPMVRVSD
jgi:nitrilase